jgi:hypothetical protein
MTLSVDMAIHLPASLFTRCWINSVVVVFQSVHVTPITNNFSQGFQCVIDAILPFNQCHKPNKGVLRIAGYILSQKTIFLIMRNMLCV